MIKDRPIIFSTEMVKAIINGNKCVTRRVIKNVEITQRDNGNLDYLHKKGFGLNMEPEKLSDSFFGIVDYCPYGVSGDQLYVRETWRPKAHQFPTGHPYEYKATAEQDGVPLDEPWKPSIHMPKDAARIWLEITGVRVERVQDITEADVKAEGVQVPVTEYNTVAWCLTDKYPPHAYMPEGVLQRENTYKITPEMVFKAHFASLWDSINEKRGYGWEANPWVWVVQFKVLNTNGKPQTV